MPLPTDDTPEAQAARRRNPGSGSCSRCGYPWAEVDPHETWYRWSLEGRRCRACFPLCEACWAGLTAESRIPYYRKLWENWRQYDCDATWAEMQRAVLHEAGLIERDFDLDQLPPWREVQP